jgi:general L-amino acid transport system permease protein
LAAVFEPVAARPPPRRSSGAVAWLRANLFGNWPSTLATLLLAGAAAWVLPALLDWLLLKAVYARNPDACQAARGSGACWVS